MSSSTIEASDIPMELGGDGDGFSLCESPWGQRYTPVTTGVSFCGEMHWTNGIYRESHLPVDIASDMSPWSGAACPEPFSSVYGGIWPNDQQFDETGLQSLLNVSGGVADGLGMGLPMEAEVAAPVLDQAMPVSSSAPPTFQTQSPLDWLQLTSPSFQPASCWECPVYTARQHSAHSGSSCSLETTSSFQPGTPATTGSEYLDTPTTGPLTSTCNSAVHHESVLVSPSTPRPRGQRWHLSNAATFRCMWANREGRCTAIIAGDRKSISSHLRDEHNFTCDGQPTACKWGGCTTGMQRRNVPRHILACHMEVKVTCPKCDMTLSRADAKKKHGRVCARSQFRR